MSGGEVWRGRAASSTGHRDRIGRQVCCRVEDDTVSQNFEELREM